MLAARAASEAAKARTDAAAIDRELGQPVAPTARSRWSFGVVLHESAEGDTLVIRCYPRKLAFREDDGPFVIEPRAWLIAGVATALVSLVAWLVADSVTALALFGVLLLGL